MSYTIRMSEDGNFFILRVPSSHGNELGHDVRVPYSFEGLSAMRHFLTADAKAPRQFIGEPGRPVQAMIDEWLAENAVVRNADPLPDLDLDVED